VAPQWSLSAAVVDPDQNFTDRLVKAATAQEIALFGKATGNIGFEPDDPFRSPDAENKKKDKKSKQDKKTKGSSRYDFSDLGDYYNSLIPAWLKNNFDDLSADYSQPSVGGTSKTTTDAKKKVPPKKQGKNT
jgi:hypothetical protein